MNIGLLAMSGVRAHDSELLALGLTLPAFVQRSKVIASLPSLGLLYLAACTPPNHSVGYFEAEADGKEPRDIYDCDLVAISTYSAQILESYAIADRLRAAHVKVAIGGLHATALPDEAQQHADYVVVGEGDNVWPEVIHAATAGAGPRIFNSCDYLPVDVAHLPVPRYELLENRPYNRFTVQTSRGCPWHCEFCGSTVTLGQRYRKRPVEHVIRDIKAIEQLRRRPFIEFADDNTFVDKEWSKELCRQLMPLRIKWFTETDISVAQDQELLELMRRAGCRQVLIGLESPSRAALDGIELRANAKARWAEHYGEAVEAIQGHGITVNGCFILGLDGQTPEIFDEILGFAMRHSLYEVQLTVLTAFPGTPLHARLTREGRIVEGGRWDLCTLFDINYRPRGMTAEELRSGLHRLMKEVYSREATVRRRAAFLRNQKRLRR